MTKRNVIVAHPGQQHSYQTALAMQEAQLLEVYLTGFYYKPDFTAAAILKVLPGRLKQVALRELGRRHLGALNPEKINSHPILELAQVLAGRLRQSNDRLLLYRNWNFQKWAGRILAKRCPSAVIAYDTSVLELFKSAKAIGALRILDQTIADRRLGLQLMRDEALLHPEWAESLTFEHMQKTEALTHAEAEAADVIIAGSEFVRTSLIERGVSCAKIAVLPYGAEENSVRPTSRVDNSIFKIVFAGSVGQRKGIKYLLEAVRRLGLPNLRLDVVGSILAGC